MNRLKIMLLAGLMYACGSEDKVENKKTPADMDTTIQSTDATSVTDTSMALVEKINAYIDSKEKNDTSLWEYTYVDMHDEPWKVEIYVGSKNDFNSVILNMRDGLQHYVKFHFDQNGLLCRMDDIEVPKHYYHEEISKFYYMANGTPFWLHHRHEHKEKYIVDTAYQVGSFTTDEFPMFYDKDWVIENIRSKGPDI